MLNETYLRLKRMTLNMGYHCFQNIHYKNRSDKLVYKQVWFSYYVTTYLLKGTLKALSFTELVSRCKKTHVSTDS